MSFVRDFPEVSTSGGAINASRGLLLHASESILNDTGQIVSYGNMELNAPAISARAAFLPTLAIRPDGLGNFFVGNKGWLTLAPTGGLFLAPAGTISVTTSAPVMIEGGALHAGSGVENPAGTRVVIPAAPITWISHHKIGLLQGLVP